MTDLLVHDGKIHSRNPADGSPLGPIPVSTPEDVRAAVVRARAAAPDWAALTFKQRGAILAQVRDRLFARADDIAGILHREIGKPKVEAYLSEVVANLDLFDYHIANDEKILAPEVIKLSPLNYPKKKGVVEHVPLGVIGLISPWNFPVAIPLRSIVPALMAGNTVVFKPSEYSSHCGHAIAGLFEGLLPKGVLETIYGAGETGAALTASDVDRLVFTGSVATGKRVAVAGAERLIPVSVELGGKDPAIVLEDADLDRAANGVVWGAFFNAGQNCGAVERVYVVRQVAEPFLAKVMEKANRVRLSDGVEGEVGPLINEKQVEIVDRQVRDAVEQGAKVMLGGNRKGRLYFEPTVLTGVTHGMSVMRDETFGPVLPIQVVQSAEEAIQLSNDSAYGLTASVWTKDINKGKAIAARLHCGVATINNHSFTGALPQAPWTGVKETGSGVTNSRSALFEMTRPRFTLVDGAKDKLEAWWFPYTPTLLAMVPRILQMAARGLGTKLAAVPKLLPLLGKRMKEG